MQIIDLSHDLEEGMPVYPGTSPPYINSVNSVYTDGYAEFKLELYTHTGTHIDAPAHILREAKTITDLNINHFLGKALTIHYSDLKQLTRDSIEKQLSKWGKPDFILLCCGWDKYWGTEQYFADYPLPDASVFYYLSQLGLKGIGIDTNSIDEIDVKNYINHKMILSSGTIIIENLKGLDRIEEGLFEFLCFPVKISNADGSPVRAVARI